jgi:hypothetical protein
MPMTLKCGRHDVSEGLDTFEITIPTYISQHVVVNLIALDCFDEVDGVDGVDTYIDMKLVAALRDDTRITDRGITDRNGERVLSSSYAL